jgi:hypothetical protein
MPGFTAVSLPTSRQGPATRPAWVAGARTRALAR